MHWVECRRDRRFSSGRQNKREKIKDTRSDIAGSRWSKVIEMTADSCYVSKMVRGQLATRLGVRWTPVTTRVRSSSLPTSCMVYADTRLLSFSVAGIFFLALQAYAAELETLNYHSFCSRILRASMSR